MFRSTTTCQHVEKMHVRSQHVRVRSQHVQVHAQHVQSMPAHNCNECVHLIVCPCRKSPHPSMCSKKSEAKRQLVVAPQQHMSKILNLHLDRVSDLLAPTQDLLCKLILAWSLSLASTQATKSTGSITEMTRLCLLFVATLELFCPGTVASSDCTPGHAQHPMLVSTSHGSHGEAVTLRRP